MRNCLRVQAGQSTTEAERLHSSVKAPASAYNKEHFDFRIITLRAQSGSVAIESVSRIRADTSALSAVDFPSWSPDGRAIAYVRQIIDPTGHVTEKEEVWIRNVENNAKMKIYEVSYPSVVMDLVWSQNGTILVQKEKDDGTQARNVSVVELSSNGKSIRIQK